ncbi:uncharacterized protein BDZ99DRAFT_468974 [Mytilinidion resinicola]|uniref:Uncharacterized protein n=1 Tax=Mytilinidion resinicola TaxID=574789 RepID=A0A6A6Y182_9PEZI|nr:uncharacterized protein BDZ99DRAFT_468974 [Mytilinidion resinicola]KAF2802532.1 hypothetical protein BDZ99DRAFT_468974 [Mytilinidion resinicola]
MDSSTLYSIFKAHFVEHGFESDGFEQGTPTENLTSTANVDVAPASNGTSTLAPQPSTSVGTDAVSLPATVCPEGVIRLLFSVNQPEAKTTIIENGIVIIMDNEWIGKFQEAALKDKATLRSSSGDWKSCQGELAKVLWAFSQTLCKSSQDSYAQVEQELRYSDGEGWIQVEDFDEVVRAKDSDEGL